MSALQAPNATPQTRPTLLRAVPNRPSQIARLPFVLIIAVLLGGGMTGVLLLSTTIQTQSSELTALQTREAELRYEQAALVAQVQDLRSSQKLAERAWDLGMRPNPNPAFIQMPSGQVVGDPSPVTGNELSGVVPPQVVAAAQAAAAKAAAAQVAAAEAAAAQAAAAAAATAASTSAPPSAPATATATGAAAGAAGSASANTSPPPAATTTPTAP